MNTKKLTLEDLKLESFLTEIDETKLVKMQGGNGGYDDITTTNDPTTTDGPTGDGPDTDTCDTEQVCVDQSYGEFCWDTNNHLCPE